MDVFWQVLDLVLLIYFILLLGRLVLDYVQLFARSWHPTGVVLVLAEIVYTATDPPLRALRRVIPPLRIGSVSLDLSFLVLIIGISILRGIVGAQY